MSSVPSIPVPPLRSVQPDSQAPTRRVHNDVGSGRSPESQTNIVRKTGFIFCQYIILIDLNLAQNLVSETASVSHSAKLRRRQRNRI